MIADQYRRCVSVEVIMPINKYYFENVINVLFHPILAQKRCGCLQNLSELRLLKKRKIAACAIGLADPTTEIATPMRKKWLTRDKMRPQKGRPLVI